MAGRQWQASMRRALMHILIRGQGCLEVEVPTPIGEGGVGAERGQIKLPRNCAVKCVVVCAGEGQ